MSWQSCANPDGNPNHSTFLITFFSPSWFCKRKSEMRCDFSVKCCVVILQLLIMTLVVIYLKVKTEKKRFRWKCSSGKLLLFRLAVKVVESNDLFHFNTFCCCSINISLAWLTIVWFVFRGKKGADERKLIKVSDPWKQIFPRNSGTFHWRKLFIAVCNCLLR